MSKHQSCRRTAICGPHLANETASATGCAEVAPEADVDWPSIESGAADRWDGAVVAISGWMVPVDAAQTSRYFLLVAECPCCVTCLPGDPSNCIELMTVYALPASVRRVELIGRWERLSNDSAGWRYRLSSALERRPLQMYRPISRRDFLASTALLGLAACTGP